MIKDQQGSEILHTSKICKPRKLLLHSYDARNLVSLIILCLNLAGYVYSVFHRAKLKIKFDTFVQVHT